MVFEAPLALNLIVVTFRFSRRSPTVTDMAFNIGNSVIRITGVGPWSVQWEYLETNRDVVKRVLADLDHREVFFTRFPNENPEYCRLSLMQVRDIVTGEIPRVEQGCALDRDLRAIRNAAKAFNSDAGPNSRNFRNDYSAFEQALDTMRHAVAPPIRRMATAYQVLIDHRLDDGLPRAEFLLLP